MQIQHNHLWHGVAWLTLVSTALLAAAFLTMALGGAFTPRAQAAPTPRVLSPVTAALADGDDIRARFLASIEQDDR
jgi:hypothetical protein